MSLYWTSFLLGLGGSIHCIGMCTPLVLAVTSNSGKSHWKRKLVYNSGRITTYVMLGGLVGWLGNALNWTNYQDLISIALGIILILFALTGIGHLKIPFLTASLQKLTLLLKKGFSKLLAIKGNTAMFSMGLINGLLPCGLTYLALTSCLAVSSPVEGVWYMMFFGLGTLAVMLGLAGVISGFAQRFKLNFQKITTVLLLFAGALLVTRAGINHTGHIKHAGHVTTLCR